MRKMVGPLVGIVALFIGIQAAAFIPETIVALRLPTDIEVSEVIDRAAGNLALPPVGVHISYIGMQASTGSGGLSMVYLIYNGSSETLHCIGYSNKCELPEILINGKDEKAWICMNGSSSYEIKPGQTAQIAVGTYDFARVPRKEEKVSVGLAFERADGRTDQYFAEPMTLPSSFRKAIRENFLNRGSY